MSSIRVMRYVVNSCEVGRKTSKDGGNVENVSEKGGNLVTP